MQIKDIDILLYHKGCRDGKGAAFAIYHYRKNSASELSSIPDPLEYIPVSHKFSDKEFKELLTKCQGKNVLIVDYCFDIEKTKSLQNVVKDLMIIDHHKTAIDSLKLVKNNIFDITHSAAYLTWKWCFPDQEVPRLILLIEDRDIWTKKYPETSDFSTAFFTMSEDFEVFESLLDNKKIEETIEKGKHFEEYKKIIIKEIVSHVHTRIQIIDNKPVVFGYIESGIMQSDIGNEVLTSNPNIDIATVYFHTGNWTKFSLRSSADKNDTTIISKKFGGGGHLRASGCSIYGTLTTLPFDTWKTRPDDALLASRKFDIKWQSLRYLTWKYVPRWIHKFLFYAKK